MRCDEAAPLIDAFAEDALDDAQRASVAAHVAVCDACARAVAASRRLSLALAALPHAAPSAAADARALAAVEEERAWARWRSRMRKVVAAASVAAAAVMVLAVFVATPAAAWVTARAPSLLRAGETWLRLHGAPALAETRGPLLAAVAVLLAIAIIERVFSRWDGAAQRAS
jgi:anti-sigma factor RsiW